MAGLITMGLLPGQSIEIAGINAAERWNRTGVVIECDVTYRFEVRLDPCARRLSLVFLCTVVFSLPAQAGAMARCHGRSRPKARPVWDISACPAGREAPLTCQPGRGSGKVPPLPWLRSSAG